MTNRVTRLAPSPTSTLHLGNLRTFAINWALARQQNWSIILRIEDLDRERVRQGADAAIVRILDWLGFDYDAGPVYQSHDLQPYRAAMKSLTQQRLAYVCNLSRKQIERAASAPNAGDAEVRFPPELRACDDESFQFTRHDSNYRFVVNDIELRVDDQFAEARSFNPHRECGDFIVWTRLGVPAYQLAVVVDDARQRVTDVVRGNDLFASAARQRLLYLALNLPEPRWWHLPLVLAADGRRLAKRDGDAHVETYLARGVRPEKVIGLLAFWCNVQPRREELSREDFLQGFRIDRLSHEPVKFSQDDHAWLLEDL